MMLRELKKDLRTLSGLLENWKNVRNPNLLQNINFKSTNPNNIDYSILESNPLIFRNIDLDRHCLPLGIEKIPKDEITVEIKLTTKYNEFIIQSETLDPFHSLSVNFIINVDYLQDNTLKEANCSWHLDKGAPSDALFAHPEYHMNFGGSNMSKNSASYGTLLLLAAPRLLHPPLDLVLGCDFIIRNFYLKTSHVGITSLPAYNEILLRAKNRYWKPYGKAFYSHWDDSFIIGNLHAKKLLGH